jgi:tetratricopeptide (TPR) repeat protein
MLIFAGEMERTILLLRDLQFVIKNTENCVIEAMGWCFQAHALHLCGDDEKAAELFDKSERILTNNDPRSPVTFPTISSYYCKFLLETGAPEAALDRSLLTFSWRSDNSWQVAIDTTSILASDMQILGLAFLELGDYVNARINLDRQVELLKEADEWLYLPSGLNARARLFIETRELEAAEEDLASALEIARRTGARLGEWETLLNLVHLNVVCGHADEAERCLAEASQVPGMDVYKFRDKEISKLHLMLNHLKEGQDSVSQGLEEEKNETF